MNANNTSIALDAIIAKGREYAIIAEDMAGNFRLFPSWLAVEHAGYNGRLVRESMVGTLDSYQGCKWHRVQVVHVEEDGRL